MKMRNFTTTTKGWLLALALMASTAATQAQTTVFEENFNEVTQGNSTSTSGSNTAWTGNDNFTSVTNAYEADKAIKLGASSKTGSITTKELDLSTNNGAFKVEFDVKGWTKVEGDIKVSIVGTTTAESLTYSSTMSSVSFESKEVIFNTGGTSACQIMIETTAKRAFIDNIKISTLATTTNPNLSVSNLLSFGTLLAGESKTTNLNLKAANLTGDLTANLTSSTFSIPNTTIAQSTAQSNEGFDLPVTFAPAAKGAHTATLTLSGGGLTQDVTVTLTGNAYEVKNMASVSALRNEWTGTEDQYTRYLLEGQALVTYASGKNMYVQDNHAGILIYDKNSDIAPAGAALGDLVSGMTGTLKLYGGLLELEINQPGLTIHSNANAVSPLEITADEFVNNFASYESRLVHIQNVNFTTADGTTTFTAKAQNLDVTYGDRSFVVRTMAGAGFESHTIPEKAHVTGLAIQYNATLQLSPRTPGDLNTTLMGVTHKTIPPTSRWSMVP
ncbi:hypothetical protein LX69_01470 [Breznakibacter xylanolyticus]|uniref:DUF5689 domain-containing protein n=2 Tax=Breznakibacter xylanolyticus TaxID=990 RepID=A0A2W7NBQ8_9BACT|nr:hypothetical protein LX69_01470 [Breznakibacter xylanolyticus]